MKPRHYARRPTREEVQAMVWSYGTALYGSRQRGENTDALELEHIDKVYTFKAALAPNDAKLFQTMYAGEMKTMRKGIVTAKQEHRQIVTAAARETRVTGDRVRAQASKADHQQSMSRSLLFFVVVIGMLVLVRVVTW